MSTSTPSPLATQDGGFFLLNFPDTQLTKVNSTGKIEWHKMYSGGMDSIITLMDGSLAGIGIFKKTQDVSLRNLKIFDPDGTLQDDIKFAQSDVGSAALWFQFKVIQPINKDDFLLGGEYYEPSNNYKQYAYIQKTNHNGKKIWDRKFPKNSIDDETISSLTKNGDGFLVFIPFSAYKFGSKDKVQLVQLDTDGNVVWDKFFSDNKGNEIQLLPAFNSTYLLENHDTKVVGVERIDTTGKTLWKKEYNLPLAVQLVPVTDGFMVVCLPHKKQSKYLVVHKCGNNGDVVKKWEIPLGASMHTTYIYRSVVLKNNTPILVFWDTGYEEEEKVAESKIHIVSLNQRESN